MGMDGTTQAASFLLVSGMLDTCLNPLYDRGGVCQKLTTDDPDDYIDRTWEPDDALAHHTR